LSRLALHPFFKPRHPPLYPYRRVSPADAALVSLAKFVRIFLSRHVQPTLQSRPPVVHGTHPHTLEADIDPLNWIDDSRVKPDFDRSKPTHALLTTTLVKPPSVAVCCKQVFSEEEPR
jgi:hypothetical protein